MKCKKASDYNLTPLVNQALFKTIFGANGLLIYS